MSSIKKVLCLKAKNNHDRIFTAGCIYDVEYHSRYYRAKDDNGLFSAIFIDSPCIYGEWQPLEQYVCMTNGYRPSVKKGDILFGYETSGVLKCPISNHVFGCLNGQFKKLSEIKSVADIVNTEPNPRHEVRHVIYDTKDNKIVNDAMGECYITLAEAQELCDEMNTPKVMKTKYTKEVEYFGMRLLVREDVKFIATSEGGVILTTSGSFTFSGDSWVNACGTLDCIHKVDLNGIDWKETLVEIE